MIDALNGRKLNKKINGMIACKTIDDWITKKVYEEMRKIEWQTDITALHETQSLVKSHTG